jgi:hypothetical protein
MKKMFTLSFIGLFLLASNSVYASENSEVIYQDQLNNSSIALDSSSSEDRFYSPIGFTGVIDTQVDTKNTKKEWIGYHSATPNWSKASSYALNKGRSYSASGSKKVWGISVNVGYSYSQSVTITYPADAKKYSKLGVYADVTYKKYKRESYVSGRKLATVYIVKASVKNQYITTVYQ